MRAARDLPACVDPFERRRRVPVDHEAAVLVVEHGIGEDPLLERVDARAAVAAEHVRERDVGVRLGDPRRVEVHGRAAVRRRRPLALGHLVEDRLADRVARPERVGELLAVDVQENRPVGARRLGNRVALHVRRPRAAVRVVLQRVEVARLGAEVERDPRHLAGGAGMVGGELAALLGLAVAAAAGGEDDRIGLDDVLADMRAPARLELPQRAVRKRRGGGALLLHHADRGGGEMGQLRDESGAVTALHIASAPLADLRAELERTFRQLAQEKGLQFAIEIAPGLPAAIRTDATRLKQILKNLVANAFQLRNQYEGEDGTEGVLGALPFFHAYGLSVCVLSSWVKGGAIHLHVAKFRHGNVQIHMPYIVERKVRVASHAISTHPNRIPFLRKFYRQILIIAENGGDAGQSDR